MKIREFLENHILIVISLVVLAVASVTWQVAREVMVAPRDFHIQTLQEKIEDLEEAVGRVDGRSSGSRSVRSSDEPDGVMLSDQEFAELADDERFSAISMKKFFETTSDDAMTNLQREEFKSSLVGKRVVWSGYIRSVDRGITGDSVWLVFGEADEGFNTALCRYDYSEREALMNLREHDAIKLTGVVSDTDIAPILEECRVLEMNNT